MKCTTAEQNEEAMSIINGISKYVIILSMATILLYPELLFPKDLQLLLQIPWRSRLSIAHNSLLQGLDPSQAIACAQRVYKLHDKPEPPDLAFT